MWRGQGGKVAKVAREELEARTGKKVVTALNAKTILQLKNDNDGKNNGPYCIFSQTISNSGLHFL